MSDYPGSVYSPRTKENRSGVSYDSTKKSVIFAEDISKDDAEIVAIETELGANPKGAYANVAARLVALAPESIFDKFLDIVGWYSTDNLGITKDNDGMFDAYGPEVMLMAGSASGNTVDARGNGDYIKIAETGKALTVDFQITSISSITSNTVYLGFLNGWSEPPGDTADFVGFFIKNGSIYGHCGDGSNKTETDTTVDLATGSQRTRLRFVFIPGTNCKFYVNDVLKATITTTLPDTEDMFPVVCIETLEDASKELYLGRILIQKEY